MTQMQNRAINMEELRQVARRAADAPFFVSDVQGALQVWRESALTHVRRNEKDEIVLWSLPASYRDMDKVVAIDLESWDPGEDATDDQRRQDISDLVNARAAMPALLAENKDLAHQLEDLHGGIGEAFYWVIGLHVLAALYHHLVRRDDTLRRMV